LFIYVYHVTTNIVPERERERERNEDCRIKN